MGFRTYLIINNDNLDRLDDPDFGKILKQAILRQACSKNQHEVAGAVGTATIMAQEHVESVLILAAGSRQPFLGGGRRDDSPHELIQKLAEQHGFILSRRRTMKPYPHIVDTCADCSEDAAKSRVKIRTLVSVSDTAKVKDEVKTRKP